MNGIGSLHPTIAEIDLSVLAHNCQIVRSIAPGKMVLAVVKANAYGHGSVQIATFLERLGVEMLGVAHVEEGITLREAGIKSPIVVLSGVFDGSEADAAVEFRLTPVVYDNNTVDLLSSAALKRQTVIAVHLKVDTGMGRIGVAPRCTVDIAARIDNIEGVKLEGLLTHFPNSDLVDQTETIEQTRIFSRIVADIKERGIAFSLRHAANSAAVLNATERDFEMVRPGIMLYGCLPAPWMHELPAAAALRPLLSLKSKITYLKRVPAGTAISYGGTFTAKKESLIGTMPIGYADGYSRVLSNRGEALVRGKRVAIAGRVCMDMTMLDVTDVDGVEEGDRVTLIGNDGNESITAEDIADRIGSIPYEVLTSIGSRIQRVYISA